MEKRLVLAILGLCLALTACSPTDDGRIDDRNQYYSSISAVKWLPGDTLVAVLTTKSFPSALKIYGLEGTIRTEIPIPEYLSARNYYLTQKDLYISQDGAHAYFHANGAIVDIDIASRACSVLLDGSRIVSQSPDDHDLFTIFQSSNILVSSDSATLVRISDGKIDSLRRFSIDFFTADFPMFLSGGRVVSSGFDSSGASQIVIHNAKYDVVERFFISGIAFFMSAEAPPACRDFFITTNTMSGYQILRFDTDLGVLDLIQTLEGYRHPFTLTGTGDRIAYSRGNDCVISLISTGQETVVPGLSNMTAFATSRNDKYIAVTSSNTNANDELKIIPLP